MARAMSRTRALVLLALSLEPQAVPALAGRLAQRGEFLADPEIRAQVRKLAADRLVTQSEADGQPVYALASWSGVDAALDRAWALVSPGVNT